MTSKRGLEEEIESKLVFLWKVLIRLESELFRKYGCPDLAGATFSAVERAGFHGRCAKSSGPCGCSIF